jgi:HAE1 family hydrophobic/amphiphilic exporter-1
MNTILFKRTTGVLVLAAVLVAIGLVLVTRLPTMMYPPTERPRVRLTISHPGISAVDFQDNYANLFEPRLLGLENLETVSSTYSADQSVFNLTFDWNIIRDDAIDAVEREMTALNNGLPDVLKDSYSIGGWQSENAGYLVMGISSPSTSPELLYSQLAQSVEPRLNGIDDVEELGFFNVEELRVDIELNDRAMLAAGVTILDVNNALQSGTVPVPLGSLNEENTNFSVRFDRDGGRLREIERLGVKVVGDRTITLGELADISIRYDLPAQLFLVGGEPVIQLTATPVEGGNVTQMTEDITGVVDQARMEGLIPADTEYYLFLDPAKFIQSAITNVVRAALIGGLLAILVVFLILGETRNTLIVALSLPVTIVLSFILMSLFNVSLNLISLGGLALAVGMVIDSTIVVMENIHRLRTDAGEVSSRFEWKKIVATATEQVRSPVVASVLTSVLVFLPISFTAPLTNAILGDQARTVIFSLVSSLFVALFLVPIVAYALYRPKKKAVSDTIISVNQSKQGAAGPNPALRGLARYSVPAMRKLTGHYRTLLERIVRRRSAAVAVVITAFGILVASVVFLLPGVPREIISPPSSDRVIVFFRNFVDYPDTDSVVEKALPDIERRIEERVGDHVVRTYANVRGRFNILFIDVVSPEVTDQVVAELQDEFPSEGNNYFNVLPWDPAELPLPNTESLKISVSGPEEGRKIAILEEIQDLVNQTELYQRVYSRPSPALSDEFVLSVREGILPGFPSLSESLLTSQVRRILGGTSPVDLVDGDWEVEVIAHYPEEIIDSRSDIENFLIPVDGQFVPLKHFFHFRNEQSISEIYAVDGEPGFNVFGRIWGNVPDRTRMEYENQVRSLLESELELPEGYAYAFENPQEEMERSINSLFAALGISIVLIYLLLSFQFNSLWIPLVILVSIPLGFIGVILSLRIFGSTVSLNSMLGTILLGGVVVNNAIILIDFWLKSRDRYTDGFEALVDTAAVRFQPILITTLTTILGMLPIALALGTGSNILQPLGIAVSGGLLISTIFTLFVVPSLLSFGVRKTANQLMEPMADLGGN